MFKVGDKVKYKNGSAEYVITKLFGKCAEVKTGKSSYIAEFSKLIKIDSDKVFIVGQQIREYNYKHLKYGDVLKCQGCGNDYRVWLGLGKKDWFKSLDFYGADPLRMSISEFKETAAEGFRRQPHSLHDHGILPNTYNSHKTYYIGHIAHLNRYFNQGADMNEYEGLKDVFKSCEGWTEEVNEALNHLNLKGYDIKIPVGNEGVVQLIYKGKTVVTKTSWEFKDQCMKNNAFKFALLHLLDKSDIGKVYEVKTNEVNKIKDEIDKLEARLEELNNKL